MHMCLCSIAPVQYAIIPATCIQAVRNELVEITYSYWDGSGHRRKLKIAKGSTIEQFLGKVREQLVPEFREMR